MDYHSTKQKMVSLLFILAFGSSIMHASPKIRIDDANNAATVMNEIKNRLECQDDLALEVGKILNGIDHLIFSFLDYKGNKNNCRWYANEFEKHLKELEACSAKAQATGQAHAAATLKEIVHNLRHLVKHVGGAHGSKGTLAAVDLGRKIDPIIKKFNSYFEKLELGTEHRIRETYKKEATMQVYLEHLQKRLEAK